jgi:hypothetical protein
MRFAAQLLSWYRSALNRTQSGRPKFSVTTQLPEGEVLAQLQQLTIRRAPGAVRGRVDDSTFVLLGPSPPGSYPRRFNGRVIKTNNSTVIEGRFQLHPIAQLLVRILSAIVLITGVTTAFEQQSLMPLVVAVLVLVGGFFVMQRQVGRSVSGEEAVVRSLLDIANGRRASA